MKTPISVVVAIALLSGCATKISGNVRLLDANQQPVTADKPVGVVVNMINTSVPLEQASYAIVTDANGAFVSEKGKLAPGVYKIEAARIGYKTATETVELKKHHTQKIELHLQRIAEGTGRSLRSLGSEQEKIINPGEVNIQPPTM